MDKTLRTLHLRLDSTSKSLTKNAVSQLIIKVLFSQIKPMAFNDVELGLKNILKTSIKTSRVQNSLEKLLSDKEITLKKKHYAVSRSNRRALEKRHKSSKDRLDRIITKYFVPFHSEKEIVIEWFSDATIEFFKSYSTEWISDLCYKKSERIKTKKEDIFRHVERRTKNNKELDKEDYNNFNIKFINCIVFKKDPDLDALLWEYGTSVFAANLLQSSIGADPISVTAFRDSKCLFDTNVLMKIGLEASDYHQAFKKLDKMLSELNITTGYLSITEQEYISAVANLNKEIIRTVSKFDYSVIKETDDEFIQSAIKRKCRYLEDFETFCEEIKLPPRMIDTKQKILIFNNDFKLEQEIERVQKDEKRKEELNTIYKNATGIDKRVAPLNHDIGLIAGVEFYRKTEKAFIISQEVSVNKYSHTKPHKENLPLAIKLETLINMLAIDNGGTEINPNDFSNLFANMIRYNLQPQKDTFQIADLSRLLDNELRIEQLPAEEVISIANKTHQNVSKGMTDEEVSLELSREFQDIKLKFIEDSDLVKENLSYEKSQNQKNRKKLSNTEKALRNIITIEETKKYNNSVLRSKIIWFLIVPLIFIFLTFIGIYLFQNPNSQSDFSNYIIGLSINLILLLLASLTITKPKLLKRHETKKNEIKYIIEERFKKEIE